MFRFSGLWGVLRQRGVLLSLADSGTSSGETGHGVERAAQCSSYERLRQSAGLVVEDRMAAVAFWRPPAVFACSAALRITSSSSAPSTTKLPVRGQYALGDLDRTHRSSFATPASQRPRR
jgi:hypothetical protein